MEELIKKQKKDAVTMLASLLTVDELFSGQYPITQTTMKNKIKLCEKLLEEMTQNYPEDKS